MSRYLECIRYPNVKIFIDFRTIRRRQIDSMFLLIFSALALLLLPFPSTVAAPYKYLSTSTPPSSRDPSLVGLGYPAGYVSLQSNVKRVMENIREKTSAIGKPLHSKCWRIVSSGREMSTTQQRGCCRPTTSFMLPDEMKPQSRSREEIG